MFLNSNERGLRVRVERRVQIRKKAFVLNFFADVNPEKVKKVPFTIYG